MAIHVSVRAARSALLLALASSVPAAPALAQSYATPVAGDPSSRLAEALRTLARSPKDFNALIAAGRASLELGDAQAAAGFFGRAEEHYPNSPWPHAGMGSTMVLMGDAQGSLTHFTRAQALGATQLNIAVDRGLAFDLLGQQAMAQSDYKVALAGPDQDEARRRLALSLAISRDIKGAEETIAPLLQRRDPEAMRINAFVLALAGDRAGARRTIDMAMPGTGARFDPFFAILPILRPEEKAAAVHLGEFPRDAAQRYAQAQPVASSPTVTLGGRQTIVDVPQARRPAPQRPAVAATVASPRQQVRQASAEPPKPRSSDVRSGPRHERPFYSSHSPLRWVSDSETRTERRSRESSGNDDDSESRPAGADQSPSIPAAPVASLSPESGEPTGPATEIEPAAGFDLAALMPAPAETRMASAEVPQAIGTSQADEPTEDIAPPPAPEPKVERDVPPPPRPKVERALSRPKVEKPARTEEPAGRFYVQLASGSNEDHLPIEFRRLRAKSPSVFRGRTVHVSQGKDLFRLVVGPFKTREESRDFVNELAKAGIDSFSYTPPDGLKFEKIAQR